MTRSVRRAATTRRNRSLEDDDDDDDAATTTVAEKDTTFLRTRDGSDDEEEEDRPVARQKHRPPCPSRESIRQSMLISSSSRARHRRRSSARFIRFSHSRSSLQSSRVSGGKNSDDDGNDENCPPNASSTTNDCTNLQELYQKAIRMNAENKINASNSWSLRLIDHIDNFLEEIDEEDDEAQDDSNNRSVANHRNSSAGNAQDSDQVSGKTKRVNFTKASCTLDASVKIYSYRVDDVHLTSYKVLANLHRSSNKPDNKDAEADTVPQDSSNTQGGQRPHVRSTGATATLESNLANINVNKLDAAFDIDPLFSKMSKAFDEGGAKGLLLANLGVGVEGCNIVFDSSADKEEADNTWNKEGFIDISGLISKLQETSMDRLPLVPQLSSLRAELSQLHSQGFTSDEKTPEKRRAIHYGPDVDEEEEADRSIHQEALERSRASVGRSFLADDCDSPMQQDSSHHSDDHGDFFAGDFDDDDVDGEPFAPRFSTLSAGSFTQNRRKSTAALLDALSSSQSWWTQSDSHVYWKFDQHNHWAGVAHWKKARSAPRQTDEATGRKTPHKTPRKSKKLQETVLVDFKTTATLQSVLLLANGSASSSKAVDWNEATIAKYSKNENVLPLDAAFGFEQLLSLFLRPQTAVPSEQRESSKPVQKTVGFVTDHKVLAGDSDYYGYDDNDDDGGVGFVMNEGAADGDDDEEYCVEELEGVRKVEKVQVGYATVAKKVDVKRLKNDLWEELQARLRTGNVEENSAIPKRDERVSMDIKKPDSPMSGVLSFHSTVQAMEYAKEQPDVTLPFYFICVLHLANEKGLRLESQGLEDFYIFHDSEVNSNVSL